MFKTIGYQQLWRHSTIRHLLLSKLSQMSSGKSSFALKLFLMIKHPFSLLNSRLLFETFPNVEREKFFCTKTF